MRVNIFVSLRQQVVPCLLDSAVVGRDEGGKLICGGGFSTVHGSGAPGAPNTPKMGVLGAPGAPGTLLLYIQNDVFTLKVKEQLAKI